jgi:hypothetical protein
MQTQNSFSYPKTGAAVGGIASKPLQSRNLKNTDFIGMISKVLRDLPLS